MQFGGAIHSESHSDINVMRRKYNRTFYEECDGAISILQSSLLLSDNYFSSFSNNTVMKSGGAVCLTSNSIVDLQQ